MLTLDDRFGPNIMRLSLAVAGDKLTGTAGTRSIEGTVRGATIQFKSGNFTVSGSLVGSALNGEAVFPDRTVKWTAVRDAAAAGRADDTRFRADRSSTCISRRKSPRCSAFIRETPCERGASMPAAATSRAISVQPGGNPQTGPFYVEGAMPNDTLVVRLNRVRTNRDWAQSGSTIMRNALEPGSLGSLKWDEGSTADGSSMRRRTSRFWRSRPTRSRTSTSRCSRCWAAWPWRLPGESSVRTTDSGRFGGNMDYNQIREGHDSTCRCHHPGALLFLGDGHAAQGDGELTGDALETSMDFEFTVDLIRDRNFGHPLAENAEFLISIGIGGSLDQALQQATSGMVRWLERDYKLTPARPRWSLALP